MLKNTIECSFVTEVKEQQCRDPELMTMRESIPQQQHSLFNLTSDGVLMYAKYWSSPGQDSFMRPIILDIQPP